MSGQHRRIPVLCGFIAVDRWMLIVNRSLEACAAFHFLLGGEGSFPHWPPSAYLLPVLY